MSSNRFFPASILALLAAIVASCSGGDLSGSTELEASPSPASVESPAGLSLGADFPGIPLDDEIGADSKSASYVSSVDPTTPIASHRSGNCAVDPGCRIIQGLYDLPMTHVPPLPHYAYAVYKVPLGASADDLLQMNMQGHTANPGEKVWLAVANYSMMSWKWFGPGETGEFTLDFESIAWDYTSPAGNMYFVAFVMPENAYHIEDLQLKFKDRGTIGGGAGGGGEMWNVWGQSFVNVGTGAGMPGAFIEFEDLDTGVTYTTLADGGGNWGMNLPTGDFRFRVYANTVIFDLPGYAPIETFDVNLTLAAGEFTYHGDNPVYDGTVIPMPLITTDIY